MSAPKDATHKTICISVFKGDLEALDAMVDQLKERGLARANRSWLIRYALGQVKLDAIERRDVYGDTP